MPTYKIVNANFGPSSSFVSRSGPNPGQRIGYKIVVEDSTGLKTACQWTRLPTSPAPTVGEELDAEGFWPVNENAPEGALPTIKNAKVIGGQSAAQASGGTSSAPRVGYQTNPVDAARMGLASAFSSSGAFVTGMASAGAAPGTEMYEKCKAEWLSLSDELVGRLADAGSAQEHTEESTEPPQVPQPQATQKDEVPF